MKQLFLFFIIFLFLVPALVLAAGEGTYGNETYGNFSYGISSLASASFSNSSVGIAANTSTIINATQGGSAPNVVLEIVTNSNTNGPVTLVKYNSQPPTVSTNTFSSPLNKYVDIVVGGSISSQLNFSIIKMYYTDAEVAAANLQESTMRLSRWNGSEWIKFDDPIGGVDTTNNFVWANTSSFSTWGIFGTTNPTPSGGGGATPPVDNGGGSLPGAEEALFNTPAPAAPATAPAAPTPAAPATAAATTAAPTTAPAPTGIGGITGAATAVPPATGLAALTGNVISGLSKPSTIAAIVVGAVVLVGLYSGYRYVYKRKQV